MKITDPGKNTLALYKQFGVETGAQAINTGIDIWLDSNKFTPFSVGGGFICWGTDAWGTPVVSINDPSTYSASDWYGY